MGIKERGLTMKKKVVLSLALVIIIMASIALGAYAASDIKLFINGKQIKTDIVNVNGSNYVPLRVVSESLGADVKWDSVTRTITITSNGKSITTYDAILNFATEKYPETAAHIQAAIAKGESAVCTIDREGADDNRSEALKSIPTKDGYDRDEWPMAMCEEGGVGADVAYVESSDNRGSGSWVGNQLEDYPNGTRILFMILESSNPLIPVIPVTTPTTEPAKDTSTRTTAEPKEVYYANCSAVKAAGAAPIHIGDPGYRSGLDRDGDGIGCES
jgi:hypothetical protein